MKKEANLFKAAAILFLFFCVSASALELNKDFIKVSLKQSDQAAVSFSLVSEKEGFVNLELSNLLGATLDEDSFYLNLGEIKIVNLNFDSSGLEPGIYFGSISVDFDNQILILPAVFEVESLDVLFDLELIIPPAYLEAYPGDKIIVQSNLYDLTFGNNGLGPTNVEVSYFIHNQKGELVYSDSESVLINKEVKLSKFFLLPDNLKEGTYFISSLVKYQNSVGISSASSFYLLPKYNYYLETFKNVFFGSGIGMIFLIIIIFIIGICLFLHFFRNKDQLYLEMRRSQKRELRQQKAFLLQQQKFLIREKKIPIEEVKARVREKLRELHLKQKKRKKEFKQLKKNPLKLKKGGNELKNKIKEWKSKGYHTSMLEAKLKGVSVRDMKKLIKKWKFAGYK